MYTYIVNWFCVHLYRKLVLCTLVQKTGFVYTCTVNWWWHVSFSYESNSKRATQSVFVCVSMFAHKILTDCTKFEHWLHKVWTPIAKNLQSLYNSLTACKHYRFKLSSSQELSKCLFMFTYLRGVWLFPNRIYTLWRFNQSFVSQNGISHCV